MYLSEKAGYINEEATPLILIWGILEEFLCASPKEGRADMKIELQLPGV